MWSMLKTQNRFVFVSPMYNASQYVGQMIASIVAQSYHNWKIILIDDVSSHEHKLASQKIIASYQDLLVNLGQDKNKLEVFWNGDDPSRGKQWEVSNVLFGIAKCDDNDIICRIDADDWLTDVDALMYLNYVYNVGCEVVWTAHRWGFSDRNISGPIKEGADVYAWPWVSSHLKTFRKSLINDVNDQNFRGEDGNYIKRAGDQAIYLPVLHKAKHRTFINRCMYHYTIDEQGGAVYQTDDAKFQKSEAEFLRKRGFVK